MFKVFVHSVHWKRVWRQIFIVTLYLWFDIVLSERASYRNVTVWNVYLINKLTYLQITSPINKYGWNYITSATGPCRRSLAHVALESRLAEMTLTVPLSNSCWYFWQDSLLKSLLRLFNFIVVSAKSIFLTWILIGWRHRHQPIRRHVRKWVSTNLNMFFYVCHFFMTVCHIFSWRVLSMWFSDGISSFILSPTDISKEAVLAMIINQCVCLKKSLQLLGSR